MEPLALTVAVLLAKGATERIGSAASDAVMSLVQRLASIVTKRIKGDDGALGSFDEVLKSPQSDALISQFASHLERHILIDPAFAQELQGLLEDAERRPGTHQVITTAKDNASVGKIATFGIVHGDVTF